MGLDSVELVMNTEEHFGIQIPDHIAESLTTVGGLHNVVVSELKRVGKPRDAEIVFAELRELICDQLGGEETTSLHSVRGRHPDVGGVLRARGRRG